MEEKRGSIQLLQKYCETRELRDEDLAAFMEAVQFDGVILDNVFCKGQPAPDVIVGSLTVTKKAFSRFATRFFDIPEYKAVKFDVFPKGVPQIRDFRIDVEVIRGFEGG